MRENKFRIERATQAVWLFVWMPLWAIFFIPWVFEALDTTLAVLAMVYVGFLPALLWFFLIEPILERKCKEASHA